VQCLHVDRRFAPLGAEGVGRMRHQLATPFRDLVWVDVEALGELSERRGAFDRGQGHFRLERR
jgi:hypothetical protein